MKVHIKILHLEDVKSDAEIIASKVRSKFDFEGQVVKTRNDFENALVQFSPDVILSDHSLPSFNSIEALKIVRERGISIPFILVTGAVSEEFAAMIIQQGADDYILKDRLERLPNAILLCLEKYRSERKNKEMVERFTLTINSLKDYAIFQLDSVGCVASWNKGAEAMQGYSETDITGQPIATFFTDEDKAKGVPERFLQLAEEHGQTEAVGLKKRKDESLYFAEVLAKALFDDFGNLKGFAIILRDITERKKAEEKLRQSEADLLNIVNRSLDVICTTDADGRFLRVSSAAKSVWGYDPEALIGQRYIDLVFADDLQRTEKVAALILKGKDVTMFENRFVKRDGTTVPLQWSAHWNDEEKVMYSIARDATEKKKLEQETTSLLNRLQSKNRDLRQFAYMVSHNLRAPIAKILGLASEFQNMSDKETILQKITDETVNLDNVVKDINKIITAGDALDEKTESIRFAHELKLIEQALEYEIKESKAIISTNFALPEMITVKGRFYNILYNLVSNAIKYRSATREPEIHIESSLVDNNICISVQDNGVGIDLEKYGKKMFMLYKRFHGNDFPGKGIGLNLVKVQAESLGGWVEVESIVQVGSIFKVYFPTTYKPKIRTQVDRIFLIDDDKLCNALSKRVLLKQISVSEITVYENAVSALSALKQLINARSEEFPDLIFLDLDMPGMDGWQFLQEFEQLPNSFSEKSKIIILSSSIDPDEIQRSKSFRTVYTFISKPLTQQKVLDLIS